MHIFYVDESYDAQKFVLSALCIEDSNWRTAFEQTKNFRRELREEYGIPLYRELHSHSFIRDCSDGVSVVKLSLRDRRLIFERTLRHTAGLPLHLFNICLDTPRWG